MLKTIGQLLMLGLGLVLVVFLGFWVVALPALVATMFGLAYLVDAKFTVSEGGKKVGYYKRSTGFVRTKD